MPTERRYAEVVVDVASRNVDKPFDYEIPFRLRDQVQAGSRVLVPFGRQRVEGYVVGLANSPEVESTREILAVVDAFPIFTEEQLALAEWIRERYLCMRVEALQCIMPSGIRYRSDYRVSLASPHVQAKLSDIEAAALGAVPAEGCLQSDIGKGERPELVRALSSLERKGLIRREPVWLRPAVTAASDLVVEAVEGADQSGLTERQSVVLRYISQHSGELTVSAVCRQASCSQSIVRALESKGLIRRVEVERRRSPFAGLTEVIGDDSFELTPEQSSAVDAVRSQLVAEGPKRPVLLHGITGSGKTEVYIRAIRIAIGLGKRAIVLVPEIALTTQMVDRFRSRFGAKVAVIHSGLSLGERFDEWRRIREGGADLVIGARSAIFAPVPDLGLIVIDEEHEYSYKQDDSPHYHAREVAEKRAELNGAVLVMGSATPSLETYHRSQGGEIALCELNNRVSDRPLPKVEIVDMREELAGGNRSIFSGRLRESIERHLSDDGQVILFLNRRGHSTFVLCRECGYVMKCGNCDVSLTYHSGREVLRCHYCNFITTPPVICPSCGGRQIRYFGVGTEKIEQAVARDFPGVQVIRMDVDTTRRKGSHQEMLDRFRRGEARVLVGTQMIAKGLDFPDVTLVGVVSADTAINLPDFRAGERTFQLITQVAGRAGRGGRPGEVIVQTYCPDHYSIVAARTHDYRAFYEQEIRTRAEAGYPPFTRIISLLFTGTQESRVARAADRVADLIRSRIFGRGLSRIPGASEGLGFEGASNDTGRVGLGSSVNDPENGGIQVLGPSPAPIARIRDNYRWYLYIKGASLDPVYPLLSGVNTYVAPRLKKSGIMVTITVDPINIL